MKQIVRLLVPSTAREAQKNGNSADKDDKTKENRPIFGALARNSHVSAAQKKHP
jgi:hypothetical protein